MSEASDIFEFKMVLFENGYPKEFLLSQRHRQMTLKAPINMTSGSNIHYLRTLICGEALCEFESMCQIGNTTNTHQKQNMLGLCT